MSAENVIWLAIFDLGEEVLVATEVPNAAVSGWKMREYDPRDLVLGTQPCAFVPESFAVAAQGHVLVVVGERSYEDFAFANGHDSIFLVDNDEVGFEGVHPVGRGEKSGEQFRGNAFGIVQRADVVVSSETRVCACDISSAARRWFW